MKNNTSKNCCGKKVKPTQKKKLNNKKLLTKKVKKQ